MYLDIRRHPWISQLVLVASQGPGDGLETHFSFFLLTWAYILVLGVDIGSHVGDPRLLRNLSEESFVAGVWFSLILNGFRLPSRSHFGNVFQTTLQLCMRKWELDRKVPF